ncbi:MAG: hypothetical protein QY326_02075 [Bdellovibrionota bacterium]|nr:MAG: hypothetical protein QY326_02075 [Bdellovibrionota bacterium]
MSTKFTMIAKESFPGQFVTGKEACCPQGTCPSILKCEDGSIVIVGKRLMASDLKDLEATGLVKVYDDEFAVRIDPQLLKLAAPEV